MNLVQAAAAALAFLPVIPVAAGQPSQPSQPAELAAAVSSEQVAIGEAGKRMAVQIWRPSQPSESLTLIVMSHGTGAGPAAHVDTAEALANAGFVVAAPMHRGDNFRDDSNVGQPHWMASRSEDVSATIDYMLEHWPGRELLDQRRVGIFGFSAGGTAALISAGGIPDLRQIGPHCEAQPEFVCKLFVSKATSAEATPQRWTHDRRIAAAVVAAPGLGFTFDPSGLAEVSIPVQLWSGTADQTVPYASNAGTVRRLLDGPVDFRSVDNASHLSFLAPCGPDSPPQLCEDREGFSRADFHKHFNSAIAEFFRLHLKSKDGGHD